ncbi:hypothetical protein PVK06_047094 [Gossypium arboreum]|uniref:Uncharacterized protein n=1 Tax=Gossypium arboreum TaxID=29729 RepID=A0ABR0MEE8_GOSAR|nr:hypothetical protein PVK06_047094 [Gossypium arboreum]
MSNTHNLDQENPCIINDHDENYGEIQLKIVTEDHRDELNIVEAVSDPINIAAELIVKVEVEAKLTTNMELKPILNEIVEKPIHFLIIAKKVLVKEVDEFDPFASNKSNKA